MARVAPGDGRAGDVWRVDGKDHEMVVDRLTKYTITLNSVSQPQPSGWGYDLGKWDDVLYRIREDLASVQVGDVVHLYVPTTVVYLLKVDVDSRRPALSAWFGYQVGRRPTPEVEDSGLYFHPSADVNLTVERRFRPYAMLESGASLTDATGQTWQFQAPFHFLDADGDRGAPLWPLAVPGHPDAATAINGTNHAEQLAEWTRHSGVEPSVFDLTRPKD